MSKFALLFVLLAGPATCGSQTGGPAQAEHAQNAAPTATPPQAALPEPSPSSIAASKAWQASYAAEAAGNVEGALAALNELPAPQGTAYLANFRRGWLQYRLAHHPESVAAYNSAILLEPTAVEARVAALLPLMAQQKWKDVEAGAEEVLKRDPENWLALQRLAFAKFSTQHFPESEQLYRRIVQLYPSDIESRASLGWALLRLGKRKEAATLFTEVLEMQSNHTIAARGLWEASLNTKFKPF
jgi:tetratricopeptide (TPR) repeat protein